MSSLLKTIAAAVALCGALAAQDLTGRWVGVADTTDEVGTKRQEQQTLEIRIEDGKLTGQTINKSGKVGFPFQLQQDGAKVNLYGFITFEGGEHLRWKLELKDGGLVGSFSALHDNPKKWIYDRVGAITAKRSEPAAASPK